MADDWYYSDAGNKTGPVSPNELKRLADSGALTPTDLVWREGMAQWVPARAVKGLFAAAASAAPAAPPSAAPTSAPPPSRRPRPLLPTSDWHPLDHAIDAARSACPDDLAETISGVAGRIGVVALYLSAAITLIGSVLLAVRANSFVAFVTGLGVCVAVVVGQYIAYRLMGACRTAIASNRSVLSSLAVPDSAFVLITVATIGGVAGLVWMSIEARQVSLFVAAVVALAVGVFAAITAVTPAGLRIDVEPDCRAAQEAVGVLTFLVKLLLRCTPLLFTAGVAFATYLLIESVVVVMKADGRGLLFAQQAIATTIATLFAVIAIPIYAYILMLLYYLTLDVVSAIVSLPGKLDLIAERSNEPERP